MTYYALVHRDAPKTGAWVYHFGDRDKDCVDFERDDLAASYPPIRKADSKVIRFPRVPTQRQINERMAELNAAVAS